MPTTLLSKTESWEIVGGLSRPSKMPGWSYGLPAAECKTGSKLQSKPGTVCSGCYALKGNYRFSNVKNAAYRRLASLSHPQWVDAMVALLQHHLDTRWFRWHDSGDLQGMKHLRMIVEVAERCPDVRFWLPTRERIFVYSYLKQYGEFPQNLVVRVSGTMIDGPAPPAFKNTSTVVTSNESCPAPSQNNECGPCRQCWDPETKNVSYRKH